MDTASINWLTTLVFAIISGGLIGLVMGHKVKDGPSKILTTPIIFLSGSTNAVLVLIGVGLVALCFTISMWHGVAAMLIGFLTETIVGAKVSVDNKGGIGKAVNITVILLLTICLPFGGYRYYQYNRTPGYSDQMSYVYECEEYLANNVHKDSEDRREIAKKVCGCLWPDLVGRYHTIGKINEKARIDGKVSIGNSEVNAMSVTCLEDYFNSR